MGRCIQAAAAGLSLLLAGKPCMAATDAGPSFDCAKKLTSSVEQRICADPKLAALDRQMADVYAAATAKATDADAQSLAALQRGWIKGRNDCWKSADVPACVETSYRQRIAELQARYRLLAPVGTGRYQCPGTPPREATAEFFETDPPTALVDFAGTTQFMFVAPSGSGARYTGGNRQFWEHQGVAMIRWGAAAPEINCPMRK
jgi:uncharacterized protein